MELVYNRWLWHHLLIVAPITIWLIAYLNGIFVLTKMWDTTSQIVLCHFMKNNDSQLISFPNQNFFLLLCWSDTMKFENCQNPQKFEPAKISAFMILCLSPEYQGRQESHTSDCFFWNSMIWISDVCHLGQILKKTL